MVPILSQVRHRRGFLPSLYSFLVQPPYLQTTRLASDGPAFWVRMHSDDIGALPWSVWLAGRVGDSSPGEVRDRPWGAMCLQKVPGKSLDFARRRTQDGCGSAASSLRAIPRFLSALAKVSWAKRGAGVCSVTKILQPFGPEAGTLLERSSSWRGAHWPAQVCLWGGPANTPEQSSVPKFIGCCSTNHIPVSRPSGKVFATLICVRQDLSATSSSLPALPSKTGFCDELQARTSVVRDAVLFTLSLRVLSSEDAPALRACCIKGWQCFGQHCKGERSASDTHAPQDPVVLPLGSLATRAQSRQRSGRVSV
jgi:hypothetical protein